MKTILLLIFTIYSLSTNAQNWTIEELQPMPEPVTNNAVCEGLVYGWVGFEQSIFDRYVYSFGGIDSTLSYSGIHNKSWRYTTGSEIWESIPDMPNVEKTIASSASFVNGKIYIIGGYTVASNGNEVSSSKVNIYDVNTNTFLADGAVLPMPIDDHVQCVYKDSLIFVVTGWSNTGNVPTVQVYDTYTDSWQIASSVTNTSDFKVFGSNGTIVGDTLYYYGGANTSTNFPATNKVKKGYINPLDPTDISWSIDDYALPNAYRMACTSINDTVFWIGGSETSYNYNAIAYDGSGIVSPNNKIVQYSLNGDTYIDNSLELPMDIRGMASTRYNEKYLCGGIETNGKVSNKLLKLTWRKKIVSAIPIVKEQNIYFQNPIVDNKIVFFNLVQSVQILNFRGQKVFNDNEINHTILNVDFLVKGVYFVSIDGSGFIKCIVL